MHKIVLIILLLKYSETKKFNLDIVIVKNSI